MAKKFTCNDSMCSQYGKVAPANTFSCNECKAPLVEMEGGSGFVPLEMAIVAVVGVILGVVTGFFI